MSQYEITLLILLIAVLFIAEIAERLGKIKRSTNWIISLIAIAASFFLGKL